MDRLDEVVGPENWKDEYAPGPDGGVICGLTLRLNGEWITKWDGADNTEFEAIKGGLSDAFKRAGYKWGIGRYLYKLESVWVPCEAHGKTLVLKSTPSLPAWALPKNITVSVAKTTPPPETNPVSSHVPSRREVEILAELGFGEKPVVQSVPIQQTVPTTPGNGANGSNGKTQPTTIAAPTAAPNGKRHVSWSASVVDAVLKNKLAANPVEAVRLLNESGLPQNISPEQAVEQLKAQR